MFGFDYEPELHLRQIYLIGWVFFYYRISGKGCINIAFKKYKNPVRICQSGKPT